MQAVVVMRMWPGVSHSNLQPSPSVATLNKSDNSSHFLEDPPGAKEEWDSVFIPSTMTSMQAMREGKHNGKNTERSNIKQRFRARGNSTDLKCPMLQPHSPQMKIVWKLKIKTKMEDLPSAFSSPTLGASTATGSFTICTKLWPSTRTSMFWRYARRD
jgi:hypothetical protein